MSQSSFEIRNAKHLYLKLVREHERLLEDSHSSDHAINFSTTDHHLFKDWLKRELTASIVKREEQATNIEITAKTFREGAMTHP